MLPHSTIVLQVMSTHAASTSKEPSPQVIELWKRSKIPTETRHDDLPITRTTVSQRLSGERSWLWTNISQMSPADQANMISNVARSWPYPLERRAMNWPLHAGLLANCVTSTVIATKTSADMVMFNAKMPFLEAVRVCPKSPFVFGVYSSGIAYYALRQILVAPDILTEKKPCSSCVLTTSVLIALGTGVLVPLMSTPYLCHYINIQREPNQKFPQVTNYLDFLTLAWEGSRTARSSLIKLIPFQVLVTAISTYSLLWGRERIFGSLDADPDFAKEILLKVQLEVSLKERILAYLHGVPFFNNITGKPKPEVDRVH